MTFQGLLASVRETALDALAHQDVPFQKLVEALQPERGMSHTPFFQVLFVLQPPSAETLNLPGVVTHSTRIEPELVKFDLTLNIESTDPEIRGVIEYNRDLFDADRIERLAAHYQQLLTAAIAAPDTSVAQLPILTAAEQRLFTAWNNTSSGYPQQPFPRLFEQQAAKTPTRIAAQCDGRSWTYAELDRHANSVAAHLRAQSCGPLVAIRCERSLEMLAGLLGIWKAGAAYVPIDLEYPHQRQAFIEQDSGVSTVLTKTAIEAAIARALPPPTPSGLTIDSTAYILYTSGSTGAPKGVVIPHRSLVNFLFAVQHHVPITADDVTLAIATISFDIATLELYLPLLVGAHVVIAPDRRQLVELIAHARPTILQATPATWRMLLEAGWTGDPDVRLLSTGEALPRDLANQLLNCGASLLNLYGPTEANYSSAARIQNETGPVSIGRPLANTKFQVLDANAQPVPIGIPGELHISGDNVTRGYLHGPAFAGVFRSGDLVRYRADGQLDYLRRLDNQVKLRGYRIELGEIEAALPQPAVVVVREERLIAYLAAGSLDIDDLRRTLATKLPGYMIPARFVLLQALPLTATGKVDRRALPRPEPQPEIIERPRTPVEEVIANIFAAVLNLDAVSVTDNFFHLGGHSLLATRLVSRLRETLNREVALRTLFEEPTVERLARAIDVTHSPEAGPALHPYPRTGAEPLSFAQQRLWFLDRLYQGESPMYNMPYALRLTGPLDVPRLAAAFNELISRHETLRTCFPAEQGSPVQSIAPAAPITLTAEDVSELHLEQESDRPFDLTRGPLLRVRLYRLAPEHHILFLNLHHIVSDGWSFGVLYRELRDLYAGKQIPALPIQYADFAQWQRASLTGERLDRQVDYWRAQLAGASPLLELPLDRPRPAQQTFRAGNHVFVLEASLTEKLKRFSREEGVTLFMTLLAGFQVLLARYTGSTDISIGTPIANRTRVEIEGLIGFFTNTLILRTDVSGTPTFRETIDRVRKTALEAYAHQDLPFEKLVEILEPERSPSYTPLFQVMFMLQNVTENLELAGLAVEQLPPRIVTARFDLLLSVEERNGRLECLLNYNSDLFDADRIERMAGHYTTLLHGAIDHPDQSITALPLLTPAEQHQLVTEWNNTGAPYPQLAYPELFTAQAARTPDRIAVECAGRVWTYAELDAASNAVATFLRRTAAGPLVGICCERSLEMLAGMLGIWKSGAAYVPIDDEYPELRQAFIRADANLATVLDKRAIADATATERATATPSGLTIQSTAYILYTSGSTGTPKGVVIPHRSLVNFLTAAMKEIPVTADDVVLAIATISFDIATLELYAPLLTGARVVIAPDRRQIAPLIAQAQPTVLQATPATWRMLLESGWTGNPATRLISTGEALPRALANQLLDRCASLLNFYGPTETNYSSVARVRKEEGPVTIGKPLANTRFTVLDSHSQLVPIGIPGELYIAGDNVSHGYWNRPELTAEKFTDGGFRTGDLVRYRANGELEYLRRLDNQVKLRGYRVELGEIEAALPQPAVVAVHEERLIAYLAAANIDTAALRRTLVAKLPDYMVPAQFVLLDALPLSPNGKFDRNALPAPEQGREAAPAPRTPLEEVIANIFAAVLGLDAINPADNFFHLGGHSLLATRVVSRIRQKLAVELPLRTIFEDPTVERLARRVEHQQRETPRAPITPHQYATEAPLSFAQERLWFLDLFHEGQTPMYNIPEAFLLTGPLDIAKLRTSFETLIVRHEILRTTFRSAQIIAPHATLDFSCEPLAEAHLPTRLAQDSDRPFNLTRGPLLRVKLYQLAPDRHALLIVMHHIVSDGWSLGVMFRELRAHYQSTALPALPIQYADYAHATRAAATEDRFEHDLTYWMRHLKGAPALLDLPADHPRPPLQTYRGGNIEFLLDAHETDALKAYCRRESVTLFMTLMAAFQTLLARYSGVPDICVGTAIANRTQGETEDLIGLFVNTLVIRTSLSGEPTFNELVDRVRETALQAYAHQDLPFEKLVEALEPARSMSYTPLFQVLFLFQNANDETFSLPGLTSQPFPNPVATARFDLSLAATERNGCIECILNYNRDLFDTHRMERMAGHLRTLLNAALQDPAKRIWDLPLLTPPELAQFEHWNVTNAPVPASVYLARYTNQARQTPEAIAIECEGRTYTYAELDRTSNAVALHLRERGVAPETLVGILVERSVEMMAGLLGIWKAGAAYVPIDPDYPAERQSFLREDSGVSIVLTPAAIAECGASGQPVASTLTPRHLAYVIYTSGSTGKPKGVAIEHGALANHLEGMRLGVGPASVMLALASAAFDMSIPELWLPLLSGGRVVIATKNDARDPLRLRHLIEGSRIDIMQATPGTWTMLLDAGWTPAPTFRLLCGAEALPPYVADRLAALPCPVWNMFGPTESTVWSTMARVEPGPVAIGKPMANTRLYVRDEHRQPVPIGVPGELYIGGVGLAREYFGRPQLTAQRFVTDVAPERLFRTGDRVRWRPDGQLEFVDRLDTQVKLRGYRIELGEIEAALERHPRVNAAAVTIREDRPGDKRLIAYIVAPTLDEPALRKSLSKELPDYMLPAQFMLLDRLPRSANGKLDRAALPDPAPSSTPAHEITAPRDPLEQQLLAIWETVLDRRPLSVTDSFFALGGHSLQATRLVMAIEASTAKRLPLPVLFASPTVRQIAEHLRGSSDQAIPHGLAAIQPLGTRRPVFLVEARSLFWEFAQLLGPDQPLFGMQWPDLSTLSARVTVPEIAAELIRAMQRRQPHGPYVVGGWCIATLVAYEIAQQLTAQGETVDLVLLFDGANPSTGRDLSRWQKAQKIAQFYASTTRFHLGHMRRMAPAERIDYAAGRAATLVRHLKAALWRYRYTLRVNRGTPVPPPTTLRDIERVVLQAALDYKPQPYNGRVVYFKRGIIPQTGYFEADFGWGRLLPRGLEIRETGGRHSEMFQSPNVEHLAAMVRDLLNQEHLPNTHEQLEREQAFRS